jgi:cell division protein FtsQ
MATRTATHALPPGAARSLRRGSAAAAAARAASAAPVALPGDVRLMNAVASLIFAGLLLAAVAAGVLWLTRAPLFNIRAITLDGELARNSVPTIRANAAPRLAGNFFSVDLQAAQAAFEAVPWVRRAVVRRVWPDRLVVVLEEHRAAALWEGETTDGGDGAGLERLVNSFGELFDANLGEVEDEQLPRFTGPDGSPAAALALYQRVAPVFAGMDAEVRRVAQSRRGSWRLLLDNGARIELGRGSEDELVARSQRFVRTLQAATAQWRAPLEYADLRHADGYAVRLGGVTTNTAADAAKSGAAARNN